METENIMGWNSVSTLSLVPSESDISYKKSLQTKERMQMLVQWTTRLKENKKVGKASR